MRSLQCLLSVVVLASTGCTTSGSGKGTKPAWKVFNVEHPQPFAAGPLRFGAMELRISSVFLEERKTVFGTQDWIAKVRATVVSSEPLPLSALQGLCTLSGTSGQSYRTWVAIVGGHPNPWRYQEHTKQPTHLPPHTPGQVEFWTDLGNDAAYDVIASVTLNGVQIPVGPPAR